MLPTILASSVIRSTHRGDSHGGIYRVNLETDETHQMLDWNNPDINWEGRGGDRGVRGLAFWGHTLYAVAGNELFAFEYNKENDTLKKVASYPSQYLKLTHEVWRHRDKLYVCSGGTDSILVFDLVSKEWTIGYYHNKDSMGSKLFNPLTGEGYDNVTEGYMHLDSVYANDRYMWYSGAFTDGLWRLDVHTGQTIKIQLQVPDTHNARPMGNGYIYNLSRYSCTVLEQHGRIVAKWDTPKCPIDKLSHTHLSEDHAVQGYTRGMVLYDKYVITGTSPATINVFELSGPAVKSVQLTDDVRNSVCGMVLYEW